MDLFHFIATKRQNTYKIFISCVQEAKVSKHLLKTNFELKKMI